MVANYFLGAIVLMLTPVIAFSKDLCLCHDNIHRYSSDSCRSTTQGSDTGSMVQTVVISVGLIIGSVFLSICSVAAGVIVKRRRLRAILKRQRQRQLQTQSPSRPRMLVRRFPVPHNMENVTSNPGLNLNVPRTGTYTYGTDGQEPVTQGSAPPYTPTLLCEPITLFAPLSYTLGSHSKPVASVEPPPYTLVSMSLPPPPYSEFV